MPNAGEVYWISLRGDGHEQHGRRPFIIIQDARASSLSTRVGIPTSTSAASAAWRVQVEIDGTPTVALVEQLRVISVDRFREGHLIGNITFQELQEIRSKAWQLLGFLGTGA